MRTHPIVTLVCAGALVCAAGCGDDAAPTPTDRSERFVIDVGDRFTVTLESNITTGYEWALSAPLPAAVLRQVNDVYVDSDSDATGSGGHQELTFEAVGDGSTAVQLWYVRPWEEPLEPIDRAQFEVIVGTGAGDDTVPAGDRDEPAPPTPADEDATDVSTLLAELPTGEILVVGSLFDDGSGLVLCAALAESFPPQCPADRITLANPAEVIADFTESGGVRWTDRPVVLRARLVGGELQVIS